MANSTPISTYSNFKAIESIATQYLPEHWDVKPLHSLCDFQQGKAHEPYVDDEGEYICVNSRFVSTRGKKVKYCTKNITPAKRDDVLMVMSDLPNGRALAKAFYVSGSGAAFAVNQRVCAITAKSVLPKFLYYLLDRNPYFLMFDDGSNQTHLSNETFTKFPVFLPTLEEQQKIAQFLDHETAKIDTLILQQKKLIELLKEKRQAVISHAVTKGLNPDAPMKDSGIEWLGEIPEGWDVCKLGLLIKPQTSISYGIVQPGDRVEGGVPFVQTTNMSSGDFRIEALDKTSEIIARAYPRSKLKGGEVILGIRASIGAAFVVPDHLEGVNLSRGVARIELGGRLISAYLVNLYKTLNVSNYWGLTKQGSTFNEVSIETVSEMSVPIPPFQEQVDIVGCLKVSVQKIDSLIQAANKMQGFLIEKRSSIISSAVTGKIDVRNWQPPEPTQ